MKIGTFIGLCLAGVFVVFVGLFTLTGGPAHPAALPETQIVLAAERPIAVEPVVFEVQYDAHGTPEIVKSYIDIYEDNAKALLDLATEEMRARENRQVFVQGLLGLLAFVSIFAFLKILDTVKTVALVRAQSASTEQHEYKVG